MGKTVDSILDTGLLSNVRYNSSDKSLKREIHSQTTRGYALDASDLEASLEKAKLDLVCESKSIPGSCKRCHEIGHYYRNCRNTCNLSDYTVIDPSLTSTQDDAA